MLIHQVSNMRIMPRNTGTKLFQQLQIKMLRFLFFLKILPSSFACTSQVHQPSGTSKKFVN